MPVYFAQAGENGPVKIGWANEPQRRLALLQCGNPHDLTVLRLLEGRRDAESWLHRHFREFRIRREWYRFDPTMLSIEPPPAAPRHDIPSDGHILTPAEIERRASKAGLTLKELCSRAGIAQSTFTRWRAGKTEPTLDVYRRIRDVLAENHMTNKVNNNHLKV